MCWLGVDWSYGRTECWWIHRSCERLWFHLTTRSVVYHYSSSHQKTGQRQPRLALKSAIKTLKTEICFHLHVGSVSAVLIHWNWFTICFKKKFHLDFSLIFCNFKYCSFYYIQKYSVSGKLNSQKCKLANWYMINSNNWRKPIH